MTYPFTIHQDNEAIKSLSPKEISCIYINRIWPNRRLPWVRRTIRAYIANARAWEGYLKGRAA